MPDNEAALQHLAKQLTEFCPAPAGADVCAWLRPVVSAAREQGLDSLTAARFIDEFYMRWVTDQVENG